MRVNAEEKFLVNFSRNKRHEEKEEAWRREKEKCGKVLTKGALLRYNNLVSGDFSRKSGERDPPENSIEAWLSLGTFATAAGGGEREQKGVAATR